MSINLSTILCCGGVPGTGGGFCFSNLQVFDTDGTWTRPAGVDLIRVIAVGGGGGGGSSSAMLGVYTNAAGGGGAGQYIDGIFKITGDIIINIGAGGLGGDSLGDTALNVRGDPGEPTVLSGGLTLIAAGGGPGGGSDGTNSQPISDIGSSGGCVASVQNDAAYSSTMIALTGGGGAGAGGANIGKYTSSMPYNSTHIMRDPILPDTNHSLNGNIGERGEVYYMAVGVGGKGIGGIAGGGGGARITDYQPQVDGGGVGARIFSNTNVDANTPLDGSNALDNTGAGGGAGAVARNTSNNNIYVGRGGNGGSGLVIIMW